jgi:hypothetical protein
MLKRHHCTPGPGAFIRRKAFELTDMRDPQFKYVADFEYWLRLGLYGKFARIPQTLATWRMHPNAASVAQKSAAMADEHISLMNKFYANPDLPPEVRKVRCEAYSWAHYVAAIAAGTARGAALKHYFKSMLYHPQSFLRNMDIILSLMLPKPLYKVVLWGWHIVRPILSRTYRFLKWSRIRRS